MWMAQSLREFSAAGCKGNSLLIRNTMSHVAQIAGTSFALVVCPGGTYAEDVRVIGWSYSRPVRCCVMCDITHRGTCATVTVPLFDVNTT